MHILQLISGTVFTILTAAGLYMAWSGKNNVFFAAALLFLIIAISCFLLAASRIRKKRKESDTDDQPDMTTDADGQSTDGTEAQPSDEEEDSEPSEDPGAAVPDEVEPPAGDEMPDEEDNSPEQEAPDAEALTDEEHENGGRIRHIDHRSFRCYRWSRHQSAGIPHLDNPVLLRCLAFQQEKRRCYKLV